MTSPAARWILFNTWIAGRLLAWADFHHRIVLRAHDRYERHHRRENWRAAHGN